LPGFDEPGRFACRCIGDACEHHALRIFDSRRITREPRNVGNRFAVDAGPVIVDKIIEQAAERTVDMRQPAAASSNVERDIRSTTGGRNGE
jgi:hypothetical protein